MTRLGCLSVLLVLALCVIAVAAALGVFAR